MNLLASHGLRGVLFVAGLCALWILTPSFAQQPDPNQPDPNRPDPKKAVKDSPTALFDADRLDAKAWSYFFADRAANGPIETQKTFVVAGKNPDCTLVVSGEPNGYLRTKRKYSNYVLHLRWRYTEDANGNSGLLLHVQEPDKVWPKCIQVQMMNAEAGAIFPLGGAKSSNRQPPPEKKIAQPVKEWNEWEITSLGGKISLRVKKGEEWEAVGEITGCEPASGYIGFQSEGAEIEFRSVSIQPLPEMKLPANGGTESPTKKGAKEPPDSPKEGDKKPAPSTPGKSANRQPAEFGSLAVSPHSRLFSRRKSKSRQLLPRRDPEKAWTRRAR
ncbi:MAG: DUF1080 domain-containing protein [Planctomycetales bacterium]